MFKIESATREQIRFRISLVGASGSGKTYSALKLAHGLIDDWNKIVVIDTEQKSSSFYSSLGPFRVIGFPAPHDPKRYVEAIQFAECQPSVEVIIIDSISPEWDAVLDIHQKFGGKFQDWAKTTPLHKKFVDAMLLSPKHIIATMRAKSDWQMDKDENSGKAKITKLGLKPVQRENLDYEFSVEFRLNENHLATVSKDRTGLFSDTVPFQISEEVGRLLASWNSGGVSPKVDNTREAPRAVDGGDSGTSVHGPSQAQLKRLFAISKAAKWHETAVKDYMQKEFKITSSKQLTAQQYDSLCNHIKDNPSGQSRGA